jgi:protein-disulfide isomerase
MLQPTRRALTAGGALVFLGAAAPAPSPTDMILGSARAKVTVVEYASLSCPHCARFHNDVFPAFRKKYIDSGKVRFVYREFLTEPVQLAMAGALLARCAGKGKYFSVVEDVFRSQNEIYETGQFRTIMLRIAKNAGLTEPQFEACMTDQAALAALNDRVEGYVRDESINSTPTFFINGVKVKEGEITLAELDQAIARAARR